MGPAKSPMGLVVPKHQGIETWDEQKLLSKVIIIIYQFQFFFFGYIYEYCPELLSYLYMEMTPYQLANNTPLTLSPNFILPEEKRPNLSEVLPSDSIPIIDLNDHDIDDGQGPSPLVSKISQACEEYGFFQIINHGVPRELCQKVLAVDLW